MPAQGSWKAPRVVECGAGRCRASAGMRLERWNRRGLPRQGMADATDGTALARSSQKKIS